MNQSEEVLSLLAAAGYAVRPCFDRPYIAEFEDAAIFGFAAAYPTAGDLLLRWKTDQDSYIQRRVQRIRNAQEKRANLYAVFITTDVGLPDERRQAGAIEENFVASRKIVGTGVTSRDQVRNVLLPLLPLQSSARMTEADLDARLGKRLATQPRLLDAVLSAANADMLLRSLLDE